MQVMLINSNTLAMMTKMSSFIVKLAGMQNIFGRMLERVFQPMANNMKLSIDDPNFIAALNLDTVLYAIKVSLDQSANETFTDDLGKPQFKYKIGDIFEQSLDIAQESYNKLGIAIKNIIETESSDLINQPIAVLEDITVQAPSQLAIDSVPATEEVDALGAEDAPVLPPK